MRASKLRLQVFSAFKPGSAVSRATCIVPRGLATKRAAEILNRRPEILISYFLFHFNSYYQKPNSEHLQTIELTTGDAKVIAHREDGTAHIWHEDSGLGMFVAEGDRHSFKPQMTIECPPYPHAKEVIDIKAENDLSFLSLDDSIIGERASEPNRPVFRPSMVLKIYDWMYRISLLFDLNGRDSLDLGHGIGTVVDVGSLFCKSSTGIEISDPLNIAAQIKDAVLRERGLLRSPTKLLKGDYLAPDFDMTPYSLVYVFKPTFANPEMTMKKLLELKKGAFVLSNLFAELLWSYDFEKIDEYAPDGKSRFPFLFIRN